MSQDRPSRGERIGSAVVGALFLGVAFLIVVLAAPFASIWEPVAALALGALGADGIASAVRGRRSLLSRIGPWP